MSDKSIAPGQRVTHDEFGDGVVVSVPGDGYASVFFRGAGERQVALATIRPAASRAERLLAGVAGTPDRARKAWLAYEAHALPLMESAAALTAARIDLLPHQVVLTHRIATGAPRRFLVADEVGLGKTIEAALILRELASRGELRRALMVVPAGLVNNWHRELNEVFHLGFEVFGSEGDVTDRKSNAFVKHHRLIASIDTLKRPARIRRLLAAPPWDLVVFDEAHHLTAYKSGGKIKKTENYKLAEALRNHTRDLLLLSATPHQGDHFRFWMLIQLLNPTLFNSPEEMVENRHRLNAVVFRRTKADACRPDGSPLFARRLVHTESFVMSETERRFYEELRRYLEDGFALAKRRGNEGRGLGFVMAIFQKIAASSFAAVRRTLRRRLLMLTLHEAIVKDRELDIDGRQALYEEARQIIREEYQLGDDAIGRSEVDRVLADLKLRLVKRLDDEDLERLADPYSGEQAAAQAEDMAASAVSLALPEERHRIRGVLAAFPADHETKCEKLLYALGALWRENSSEKVVVFATYLGTVDLLGRAIEATYPGQGVVVLRGGDHGAKLAAERRFKQKDGPRVLVCTAAGREGINLQFARILFNFDLPWNPMDLEQRIGRIHRYGQNHTAQVYNLVLSDTIEGRIFLLLDDKLREIARTLGKVDEHGNVAEDLRSQILGQLAERLSYDRLYQEALSDPELRRTRQELEAALANASEARKVVFELFQDLEGFSLEDYKPFADVSTGVDRLVRFLTLAEESRGGRFGRVAEDLYELRRQGMTSPLRFTTQREIARERADVELLGLDHPSVEKALSACRALPPEEIGVAVEGEGESGVLTVWQVQTHGKKGDTAILLQPIGIRPDGARSPTLERRGEGLLTRPATTPVLLPTQRPKLLAQFIEPMLRRELLHRGVVNEERGYSAELIGWIEVVARGGLAM
jgi:superfamily II DNA or RNA helicase